MTSPTAHDTSKASDVAPRRRADFIAQALNTPLASYYLVVVSAALLSMLGLLMVLSASSVYAEATTPTHDAYYFFKRQLAFGVIGVFAAWWLSRTEEATIRLVAWGALAASFVLLLLTFTPLGVGLNGNRNWVQFGSPLLRFQPSEIAKFAIVTWGAVVLAGKQRVLDRPKQITQPFVTISMILIGLVVLERDVGTALVMGAIVVAILWVIGAPLRVLGKLFGLVGIGLVILVAVSPNRMNRIFGFLNPEHDAQGVNQQPLQAMYALASGGWWGAGLGASKQKWGMLVEAHTDYIFAVVGEELGLIGSLAVLALFLVLGYAGIRVALRSDQPFWRYASAGLTAWFMIQAIVNIAVVLRLVPVVGVTLPLVSYGGSSLIANLAAVGVLLAAARHEPAARAVLAREPRAARTRVTSVVGSRRG